MEPKRNTPTAERGLRLVEDGPQAADGGPEQRPLPVLCLQPAAAPARPFTLAEIAPDGAGGYMLTADVTPERRAELIALLLDIQPKDKRSSTTLPPAGTPNADAARMAAFRQTLLYAGRQAGTSALKLAGDLYARHGAEARRALAREWTPAWPVPLVRLDALLARAGAGDPATLPGL